MAKKSKLEKSLEDIHKLFGSKDRKFVGAFDEVNRLGGSYSTGSLQVDNSTNGGFPKGHMTEIKGPNSAGKTTCCLHAIKDCQEKGDRAAFIDMEGTFDKVYAKDLGVDMAELQYSQADTGEQALTIAEILIRSGEINLIVIDSIATLLPEREAEGDYGDAQMGSQAKLMSQACRKLTPVIKKHNVAVVFTNQIRMKIGGYGNPEVTPGGHAMEFYASLRLDIRRSGSPIVNDEGIVIGEPRKIKIVKSKISPHTNAILTFDIYYGQGIDQLGEVLDMAIEQGIIEKKGSWFSYEESNLAQGRENTKQFLIENPEVYAEIKKRTSLE